MSRITNNVNPHKHLLSDVDGIGTVGGVETFTFAPNTPTDGMSFGTYEELYAAYTQSRGVTPGRFREISFDPRGLPAGIPVPLPAITGTPTQTYESQTAFTSKGNPSNRISVAVAPSVKFDILPDLSDPAGPAILSFKGVDFFMEAGAVSSFVTIPASRPLKVILLDSSLSTKSIAELLEVVDGNFILEMIDSDLPADTGPVIKLKGVAKAFNLSTKGLCTFGRAVIESDFDLSTVLSSLSSDTRPAAQPGIRLPAGVALFAPAASANVRPAYSLSVLAKGQLSLVAPSSTPQILQAFPFRISGGVPVVGNTLNISTGLAVETFTFVAAAGAPFEVTIGGSAPLTMQNLVGAINTDSLIWKSELVTLPGGGGIAVAIIRMTQTKEGLSLGFADRAWGTIAAAANPIVGSYPDPTTGEVLLSYSRPNVLALPAADPVSPFVGWSTVSGLGDKSLVTVIDDDRSGIYQATNPLGGVGSWMFATEAISPPLLITAAGTYIATRATRFVRATLGALDVVNVALYPTFEPGVPLCVFRTDNTAGTMNLVPVTPDTTINGVAAPFAVAGGVNGRGFILQRDGAGGWWTVGTFA